MTEAELRAIVRDAVARHLSRRAGPPLDPDAPLSAAGLAARGAGGPAPRGAADHPSHAMYLTLVNVGESCVIEPAVSCNHCNYCKSHGH